MRTPIKTNIKRTLRAAAAFEELQKECRELGINIGILSKLSRKSAPERHGMDDEVAYLKNQKDFLMQELQEFWVRRDRYAAILSKLTEQELDVIKGDVPQPPHT